MPIIHINWRAGRSLKQKEAVVKGITDVVAREAGANPENVFIFFHEIEDENMGRGGRISMEHKR